jgi:hypothetical protein
MERGCAQRQVQKSGHRVSGGEAPIGMQRAEDGGDHTHIHGPVGTSRRGAAAIDRAGTAVQQVGHPSVRLNGV